MNFKFQIFDFRLNRRQRNLQSAIKNRQFNQGFTLIELLTVIAIIGILAAIIGANVSSARRQARDARRLADIKAIQTAVELAANEDGLPPGDPGEERLSNSVSSGSPWIPGLDEYLSSIPQDPLGNREDFFYRYQTGSGSLLGSYVVEAVLEDGSPNLAAGPNFNPSTATVPAYYRTGTFELDGKVYFRVSSGATSN